MASGGGHVTAVSSYIAYARALNRLGWTPAEFVVAESFTVRLRGMLGRRRLPPADYRLSWRFRAVPPVHTCFMAYSIDIAFIDRKWQCSCMLRKHSPLGACVPPMRLGGAGAPFNLHRAPCLSTRAGVRIDDNWLSSYEIW